MKLKSIYTIFLLLCISFISCTNNKINQESKKGNNRTLSPEIIHLQDTYYYDYFLCKELQNTENDISYLFHYVNQKNKSCWVLTNEESVSFDDGVGFFKEDDKHNAFFFSKKENISLNNAYKTVKVNFLESIPIHFTVDQIDGQKKLTADFENLTVNTLQNFLDYAQEDDLKKSQETYIYELYNKDKVKKVVLTYHDNGQWFEVEIL